MRSGRIRTLPVIFPSIEVKEIEGKSILVIEVKESQVKPVFTKIDKLPVAFKRVGKTNQKADVNELRRIISEGKEFLWDSQICEEASLGSSLFCMGNPISLLSAEADYLRGMLNVERP